MAHNYTAVIMQDAGWWIGWIEEVPGVNCQESTREALLETLRVTLKEALELNRHTLSMIQTASKAQFSMNHKAGDHP